MKGIGIRVTPKEVYYTIIESLEDGTLSFGQEGVEKITIPVSLDVPTRLTYVRQALFSVINEFQVTNAGIRIHEGNSRNVSVERLNLEGVIQELLANSTVEKYFVGTINTIAKHLKVKNTELSKAFKEKSPLSEYEIEDWDSLKKEEKESLMTAIASLNI